MKWSDGDAGDRRRMPASRSRSTSTPSPPERTSDSATSIRRVAAAGRHEGRVPGRPDHDHDHQRPVRRDRSSCTSRSCRSTSGATRRTRRSARTRRSTAPQVGSGPYQLTEWKTGEFAKFERNPDYWGKQGAADEIVIQQFGSVDTLVQALKAGEIDYARGANAEQFDALKTEPNIVTVAGQANGWTQLGFNTYGTGTGNTIPDGGPSTQGAPGSGLPRCPRLRHRQAAAARSDPPGLRRHRHHPDPAGAEGLARRAHRPPDLRPGRRRPEADGRRLRQGRVRGPARQGRQARSASRWSSRAATRTTPRPPSSSRAGSSRSASRSPRSRTRSPRSST